MLVCSTTVRPVLGCRVWMLARWSTTPVNTKMTILVLLRRERSDHFFEARITAQRIPHWIKTQATVARATRDFCKYFELRDGQIAFAGPRVDPCQIAHKRRTLQRVFCDWHEFDRPTAFP